MKSKNFAFLLSLLYGFPCQRVRSGYKTSLLLVSVLLIALDFLLSAKHALMAQHKLFLLFTHALKPEVSYRRARILST